MFSKDDKGNDIMPKNSLYKMQCPWDCPHCPDSRHPDDCTEWRCAYNDMDSKTAGDRKFHALRDEGKLDDFGRRKGEEEI